MILEIQQGCSLFIMQFQHSIYLYYMWIRKFRIVLKLLVFLVNQQNSNFKSILFEKCKLIEIKKVSLIWAIALVIVIDIYCVKYFREISF